MSQQNNTRKNLMPKTAPANTSIDKSRLDIKEIEKMKPHEQKALLDELQQELKAETVQEAAPLLEFVLKHIKTIIAFVVIAIIALSAWGFWQWNNDNEQAALTKEFQKIVDIQNAEEKLKALEAFSQKAPENLLIGLSMEEAKVAVQTKNYAMATEKLEEAIKLDNNTPLSLTLNLALADVFLQANNPQKALELMEAYAKNAPTELYTLALEEVAVIAETLNNKERALEVYQELIERSDEAAVSAKSFYQSRITELSK